jgi:hypothetical protein
MSHRLVQHVVRILEVEVGFLLLLLVGDPEEHFPVAVRAALLR